MKFYYFTPTDVQVARVDRQCIIRFCEAVGDLVERMRVVSVRIRLSEHERAAQPDLYELYGVRPSFEIALLPTRIHQERWTAGAALTTLAAYAAYAAREFLVRERAGRPVVYLKNYAYMAPFLAINALRREPVKLIFEIHSLPTKAYQRRLLKRADGVVANSHALKRDLEAAGFLGDTPLLGSHQGVNLDYIEAKRVSKAAARRRLGLPEDEFLAVYTGKVYDGYEEIDYYVEAAGRLRGEATVVVVGGRSDHVERIRRRAGHLPNLRFIDFVPPSDIYDYHFAADALLLYYPPGIAINDYRSPGKLFEYMASGNPIVAADYPVLEEVVTDGVSALVVGKDDPAQLVAGIRRLKDHPGEARTLAENALAEVRRYTWRSRAESVLDFIGSV